MSAYPFYKNPRLDDLHKRLIAYIYSPQFRFQLPKLSPITWNLICTNSGERERLEFIGDRIISALIAEELYKIRPGEDPAFYTNASTVLVANSTFAHIMHKLGYHDIATGVKPAGDAFETVMAAYKQESSQESFEGYAKDAFRPLIRIVCNAYDQTRSTNYTSRKKQSRLGNRHLLISRSWTKSKAHPTPRAMLSSAKRKSAMPIIIDLTLDDDTDVAPAAITDLPQASSSKVQLHPSAFLKTIELPMPSTFTQRIPSKVACEHILRQVSASSTQHIFSRLTMTQPVVPDLSTVYPTLATQLGSRNDPICLD